MIYILWMHKTGSCMTKCPHIAGGRQIKREVVNLHFVDAHFIDAQEAEVPQCICSATLSGVVCDVEVWLVANTKTHTETDRQADQLSDRQLHCTAKRKVMPPYLLHTVTGPSDGLHVIIFFFFVWLTEHLLSLRSPGNSCILRYSPGACTPGTRYTPVQQVATMPNALMCNFGNHQTGRIHNVLFSAAVAVLATEKIFAEFAVLFDVWGVWACDKADTGVGDDGRHGSAGNRNLNVWVCQRRRRLTERRRRRLAARRLRP